MSKESENIDRIFKVHEAAQSSSRKMEQIRVGTARLKKDERAWADGGPETVEEPEPDDYHPIQQRDDNRTGCLGGLMYTAFILCCSVILACLAWMAASDALALNKEEFTATVVLPQDIFETEIVEVTDEDGEVTGHKTVTHADLSYLSNTLHRAGLVEYRWLFEMFCRLAKADEKVRPGEYQLSSTYDYRALVQNMRPNGGGAVTVNVTLTEGLTMREMFVLLERQGVSSFDSLMEAAADYNFHYDFLNDIDDDTSTRLEGFLFPETYNFYVNMEASSAINKFLEQFNDLYTEGLQAGAEESVLSLRELVTIASMIEKEAADDEERATISSVIWNRLLVGMNLGIDATILYVHPEHDGAPTADMLEERSPYNTRLSSGLPPTPICNPGLPSLLAAMNPANTSYYYYALDTETGRHRFFSTQDEFNAFVATQNY